MDNIKTLTEMLKQSKRPVFFGGAGVSTESGIPDFRGSHGLFAEKRQIPAEEILHISFFESRPEDFYDFYREKLLCLNAKPNNAHLKLAELEKAGKLSAVITQNIDGLHQAAGSLNVIEMHGSIHKNVCTACGKNVDLSVIIETNSLPLCSCGGLVRPKVTLYGEPLDHSVITAAVSHISKADMLIVAGTSLQVYPVAGLLGYFKGKNIVMINKTPTAFDQEADLVIRTPVGEALGAIDLSDIT